MAFHRFLKRADGFYVLTPVLLGAALTLAMTFWFTTRATAQTCTVCHKRTQTLMFPCNSLQYAGHLGHGDPMGACPPTMTTIEPAKGKIGSE